MPSSQNRIRHVETDGREHPNRSAISVFDSPSAANKIAFARTTSRYGPEYAAARRSSACRCSPLNTTVCGDFCGMPPDSPPVL
jgi:hypothetical protein